MVTEKEQVEESNKGVWGVLIGAFLGCLINWLYADVILSWKFPVIVIVFMFVGSIIGSELE